MQRTRPHRFANRVGGEGGFKEECPPCKLIDVGNAKRYMTLKNKGEVGMIEEILNKMFKTRRKKMFNNVMGFAKSILDTTKKVEYIQSHRKFVYEQNPLLGLVRLLGRNVQAEYLTNMLYITVDSKKPQINSSELLFDEFKQLATDGTDLRKLKQRIDIKKEMYLSRDLILPWPWKRGRLCNGMVSIGKGRANGVWKEDETNHFIELWLPIGIGWVKNGNHSIAVGIIQGEGKIEVNEVYDISSVYDYVYCDGIKYYRKEDGCIISSVKNMDFAAIGSLYN